MRRMTLRGSIVAMCLTGALLAQSGAPARAEVPAVMMVGSQGAVLAPELALARYDQHSREQSRNLPSYENRTVVHAELPDSAQKGDYELIASYTAEPRALNYTSVRFEGDHFVKGNVILRLLEAEVEHVRRGDDHTTAISAENYRFSYKGAEEIRGHQAYVFQLKPRRKVSGLFKGRIFLDATTGSMLRMEGTMVKSPSFFVHDIRFTQDFEDIEDFTLPTELRSSAHARFIGRTEVSILHHSYKLRPPATPAPAALAQAGGDL